MEQNQLHEQEAKCIQENPPGCIAGCPVHVDVRSMIAAIRKSDYSAGFFLFNKKVPFPRIISRICDHPCQQVCKRTEIDDPILVNTLERTCVDNTENQISKIVVPQPKEKKVAIVGSGLSGLTAAIDLARKGYKVAVFEATDRLGGSILDIPHSELSEELIERDFAVFNGLTLEFNYNKAIGGSTGMGSTLDRLCGEYDAVYLGVGCRNVNLTDFGLTLNGNGKIAIDPLTLATSHPKVFAGGSYRREAENRSPISSIADGRIAAISIDRLCQSVSLTATREKEGAYTTSLYTNITGIAAQPVTTMANPVTGFTKEEAVRESSRCLLCECLECVKKCEYLAHYGSYPKRYVREIYNNLSIVMGFRHSNQKINSCSLCGLCGELCPNKLDMAEVCLEARQTMVKNKKMPPSVHEFALLDMQVSNSDQFALKRHQPDHTSSNAVFFPGCQLAASAPQYVKQIYEFLEKKIEGGIGLMLGCCGAPADWAGQEKLTYTTIQAFGQNLRDLGSPSVITACPSCFRIFSHYLPDIQVEMIWTLFDRLGLPDNAGAGITPHTLAVHDSCATRYHADLHNSVRNILGKLGHKIEELPRTREKTICCGYGGLMIFANREIAHKEINRRINESQTDYVVYCAMCRDNFASQGKRAYHMLNLIFGTDEQHLMELKGPGYSQRQENRARLKRLLLKEIWDETIDEHQTEYQLIILDTVRRIIEDRMILDSDIMKVIAYAESTGNKLQNSENDHYIAYFKPANVTYWVEYSPQGNEYLVHNAYCHRLNIT
jgi:NADPH-dependent glutamate synthase beta subunit-like oxidoreductase